MPLDIIQTPDGVERRLGCVLPGSFPTEAPKYGDVFAAEILSLDAIRAGLAGKASMWGRRQRFAGTKYIRNQQNHGSCNGFSTAAAGSRVRELRGEPYVCLSGADAYSQMNGGSDNGSALADGQKVWDNGIAPESMVPWNMIYSWQIPATAKSARSRFAGLTSYAVDTEQELATALYLGRLAIIAVHATNSFNTQDGNGVNRGVNGVGNHSTMTQDIRLQSDGTLNYDMANSWDVTWLDGGYTWLTWNGQLKQTVNNHRFWVLVSSTDDPGDDSDPPPVKP